MDSSYDRSKPFHRAVRLSNRYRAYFMYSYTFHPWNSSWVLKMKMSITIWKGMMTRANKR